jgi:hypothetical protein
MTILLKYYYILPQIIPHFDKIIDYLTKEDLENIQIFTEPSNNAS